MPSSSLLSRILLALAIILTVAAGGKNFLNKSALTMAREDAKGALEKASAAEEKAKKATADIKAVSEQLKIAEESKVAADAKTAAAAAEKEKARKEAEETLAQVKTKETEIADLKTKIPDPNATPAAAPTPDPAVEKALEDAKALAAEKEALLKTVQAKADEAEKKSAAFEAETMRRQQGLLKPGLEGKILAVNTNWSFVVLNIGDRQGVISGASLLVKRAGNLVAKVRVTSVEPSTSIADIQPGSAAKGVTVQPGDVVIFPGS